MRFKRFLSGVAATVVFSATLAAPGKAVVSYDTITGHQFNNGYWNVGSSPSIFGGASYSGGVQFIAAANGYIDSLTLSLYGATSGTVILYSDNGSNMLGTALATLSLNESTTPNSFATGSYASGTMLQQGEKYWVLAVAPTNAPLQRWNYVNYLQTGPLMTFHGITSPCCASIVTSGNYVGPNSVSGFGLKVTIASAVGAPIPEPATWAMLVAGFGMVGAAWRGKIKSSPSAVGMASVG
jgi:hypothetical protein